jgi:hypothetical protein
MTITIKGRVKIDERFGFLTKILVCEHFVCKAQHDFGRPCCPHLTSLLPSLDVFGRNEDSH